MTYLPQFSPTVFEKFVTIHCTKCFSYVSSYQFTPNLHQTTVVVQTLLKALMNLPRTDFYLCKCLIDENHMVYILTQYSVLS